MVDQRLKELRGPGRREFLKWSATVAACLGVERSRFLNVLGETAGTAAADSASCANTNLGIELLAGGGGLSNFTQVFPFAKVIGSTNAQYSHYALGKGIPAVGYDRPFTHAPDSPWQAPNSKWKISAFLGGNNETHTNNPLSSVALGANSMHAAAAAIQQANPTLLPVLSVGNLAFGAAPGAPAVAAVGAPAQLIDLFNSAASKALLQAPENGSLAEAYYKAFLGLNAAAGRTTVAKQYGTGKVAINLLSKNLAAQLTPTAADLALFGITGTTPTSVTNMSNAMITTVKAFSLGLTSMLMVPAWNDDPHGLFAGGDAAATVKAVAMGKMFNGLYDFAKSKADPGCSSKTLADRISIAIAGDTFKSPFNRAGWGDGTPMGSNVLYVMGNGYTKSGWFGDMDPTTQASGWDQGTGDTGGAYTGRGGELGASAAAAYLFSIARGDMRRVRDFYNGKSIDGVVNINVTG